MGPSVRQAIIWLALFGFWAFVSRNNHPDLISNAVATSILLLASAGAIVVDRMTISGLMERTKVRSISEIMIHVISIAVIGLVLGLIAATFIKLFYDFYIGDDPRRFPFVNNIAMDSVFVVLHMLLFRTLHGISKALMRSTREA